MSSPRPSPASPASPAPPPATSAAAVPARPDAALLRLGWDDAWAARLAAAPGLVPARVSRAGRGRCEVLLADDDHVAVASVTWSPGLERAVAADPVQVPAAGDWVGLARPTATGGWTVHEVLPRRTAVLRAQVARGSSHAQVLAANADVVAVVEAMAPDVDLGRVERLLALAWSSGAEPWVVLTKADLAAEPAVLAAELTEAAPGARVLAVSAVTGAGLVPLRERLGAGATVALLGASGAGKSTLLNALVDHDVMTTRALRTDGKGRHTTVTRELHLAPGGGAVLDTPGLRTIGLSGEEALGDVFAEVEELATRCRFGDCEHRAEPGCAVLAAVDDGVLPQRRLDSYRKLQREVRYQAARVDARLRAELTGRLKAQHKAYRRHPPRG